MFQTKQHRLGFVSRSKSTSMENILYSNAKGKLTATFEKTNRTERLDWSTLNLIYSKIRR